MSELKPCPFCGSDNVDAVTGEYCIGNEMYYEYFVICRNCNSMSDYGDSLNDVVKAWNRRAEQ